MNRKVSCRMLVYFFTLMLFLTAGGCSDSGGDSDKSNSSSSSSSGGLGSSGPPDPSGDPENGPITYYMYPKNSTVDRDNSKNFGDSTSEIILTAFDFGGYQPAYYGYYIRGMENYWNCDGATLNGDEFTLLYSLMGLTYGGDGKNFKLPDLSLSDKNDESLTYQICHNGEVPSQTGAPGTVVGDIKYFAHEGLPGNNYLGQIFLIKNLDESQNPQLKPCRGQLFDYRQNEALFSLLGNRFGGNGYVTFALPDLSNVNPPVEGAEYYIVWSSDKFPHRN